MSEALTRGSSLTSNIRIDSGCSGYGGIASVQPPGDRRSVFQSGRPAETAWSLMCDSDAEASMMWPMQRSVEDAPANRYHVASRFQIRVRECAVSELQCELP